VTGRRVLVLNTGSNSLKVRLLDGADDVCLRADLPPVSGPSGMTPLDEQLATLSDVDVVGHRIVHGGSRFRTSVVVDDAVEADLDALGELAPLHNPPALAVLRAARRMLPVPHVACFDTAFHAGIPAEAATFAVPAEWRERWGLRRYGFHGLSHGYASRRAAELTGRQLVGLRVVVCHLGAGASLCAVVDGRSVDTTMGFTPLDGLVMATRSGSLDPGALLWLQRHAGLGPDEMEDALEHRSGLLGLSGIGDSPGGLYAAADAGSERARLALDVYLHRLCASVAAMATAAAGLDVLVFTGGVGEHCPRLRAEAVARLGWLNVTVGGRNDSGYGDALISPDGAPVSVCVVEAREDLAIAAECRRLASAP